MFDKMDVRFSRKLRFKHFISVDDLFHINAICVTLVNTKKYETVKVKIFNVLELLETLSTERFIKLLSITTGDL